MNFSEFRQKFEKEPVKIFNSFSGNESGDTKSVVTICIQTFNHVNFIEKCLKGILLQETSFPIEILLADDDSTDGTREICIEYAKKYPEKIKLFLHSRKNNIKIDGSPSPVFSFLYNLFSARGKYIAICEGDDFWIDPLKLQKQFEFMETNSEYVLCYHDFKIVDSSGMEINSKKASPLNSDLEAKDLLLSFKHPAPLTTFFCNVFNNEIPFQITKVIGIDVFISSLLGQKGSGKFLDEIKPSMYRVHNGGIWSKKTIEEKLFSKINTYEQLSFYYSEKEKKEIAFLFKRRIKKIKAYLLFMSFKNLKPSLFLKVFKTGL